MFRLKRLGVQRDSPVKVQDGRGGQSFLSSMGTMTSWTGQNKWRFKKGGKGTKIFKLLSAADCMGRKTVLCDI